MSEKKWSTEQREAAADRFSGRMMQTGHELEMIVLPCGDKVLVLRAGVEAECELTAKEAELAEAVELLRGAMLRVGENPPTAFSLKVDVWLERNTPDKEQPE